MVIFTTSSGEVEVRLKKTSAGAEVQSYFDEYAKLGVRENKKDKKFTRYIVPENTTYAIEISLKKGYKFADEYKKFWIQVFNVATKKQIIDKLIIPNLVGDKLAEDQIIQVATAKWAVVAGEIRVKPQMAFQAIIPDEALNEATNYGECSPSDLGSIQVSLCKSTVGDRRIDPKIAEEYNKAWEETASAVKSTNQVRPVQKVDEQSYNKYGITHQVSLIGGAIATKYFPSSLKTYLKTTQDVDIYFLCRAKSTFEEQSIVIAPIPLVFQPWEILTSKEQETCFKELQAHDKKETWNFRKIQAGPSAIPIVVYKSVYEPEDVPNYWRSWSSLKKQEKGKQFRILQTRRKYIDKGQVSPTDLEEKPELCNQSGLLTLKVPETSKAIKVESILEPPTPQNTSCQITPQVTESSLLISNVSSAIKIESTQELTVPQNTNNYMPTPPHSHSPEVFFSTRPAIKIEPTQEPTGEPVLKAIRKYKYQPSVIVLDDSDDEKPHRAAKRKEPSRDMISQTTIKSESIDEENVNLRPIPTLSAPSHTKDELIDVQDPKRAKLDHVVDFKIDDNKDDGREKLELARLKEEDEREDEELQAAQRVADLIRKRNERKSKISEMESRLKIGTPSTNTRKS